MKEYQARTKDLKEIAARAPASQFQNQAHALQWFGDVHPWVLVLAEWESESEADKARLDWISENGLTWRGKLPNDPLPPDERRLVLTRVIDHYRNAPQPKVTVIEVGKGEPTEVDGVRK